MIQYKEQDWLPGEGNGGMEQLGSGGKVSMVVSLNIPLTIPLPPAIIRPDFESCIKQSTHICI